MALQRRIYFIPRGIDLFLDSAHNPSGIKYMVNIYADRIKFQLENQKSSCKIIFGTSPQSDMDSFISPLIEMLKDLDIDQIILSKPTTGRYPGSIPLNSLSINGRAMILFC